MKRETITGLTLSALLISLWALAACGSEGSSRYEETRATEPTSVDPRYVVLNDLLVRP